MSNFPWPVQRNFKEIYDRLRINPNSILNRVPSNNTSKELNKRNGVNMVQGLNLKQLGKSIKYMTINERDTLKIEQAKILKGCSFSQFDLISSN